MNTGYDSIYLGLISELSRIDFRKSADRLGLDYVNGGVQVSFLQREYRITSVFLSTTFCPKVRESLRTLTFRLRVSQE
jgi:hypothetical protein